MPHINLLIKPASSLCNMRCRYCFYADEAASRALPSTGLMAQSTADLLIRRALDAAGPNGSVSFGFQGGEPTMAGKAYFQAFVESVRLQNTARLPIQYSLQTNGLAIDREWAAFLSANRFLVGISLDGDKAVHDEFRLDASGKGTWRRVQESIRLLQQAGVACNLLCVITRRCAKSGIRCYHAMQKTGVRFLQFVPCLDPLEEPRGLHGWSLTPKDYGSFLCTLFDEWFRGWKSGHYTSIRLFDDYVSLAMGLPAGTCATTGRCGDYLVIESDGSVYPCDFYALDSWKLGTIRQDSLSSLLQSAPMKRFLQESARKPAACESCPWQPLCRGGCRRDWTSTDAAAANYYCAAYRRFFSYAAPRIREIARAERLARNLPR